MSGDKKIIKKILKNGLRVIMIPINNTEIISLGTFVETGSRFESIENNGIAHFLEHMVFKGTNKRSSSKLLSDLDKVGAIYNAGTSYEYTYYEIHGNHKDGMSFLDILLDIYKDPKFNSKDIKNEKGVVMEEINMNSVDGENVLHKEMNKLIYKNTPMSRTILGPKENISKFTRKDFIDFRKNFYIPTKTVIGIAGNFDVDKVFTKINKSLGSLKNPDKYNYRLPIKIIQERPHLSILNRDDLPQTLIMITFRSIDLYEINKGYILDFIADILTGGSTSKLFYLLRTKLGAVYFVSAYSEMYTDNGTFTLYMGVDNSRVDLVLFLVLNELTKLRRNLVTDADLKKVKKLKETSLLFALQQPKDHLFHHGFNELFLKRHIKIQDMLDAYKKIHPFEIREMAKQIFQGKNLNIVIMGHVQSKNKIIDKLDEWNDYN